MSAASTPPSNDAGAAVDTPKFADPKFVAKDVNDYVLKLGFRESDPVEKLRLATASHPRSVMMGDPIEAAMFGVLLPAMGAKKVVEVGVFTGYTTLILAQAVGADGKVIALDVTDEYAAIGKPYWEQAGVADRVDLRVAPAADSLRAMISNGESGTVDFAFIDADQASYEEYYELLLKLLRKDGIIAIDNVLWSGIVLTAAAEDDHDTKALQSISNIVHEDDRVEHVLLPIADGVTLVRKK